MRSLQYEFHLFGARAGKTCVLNGHKFVNGVYRAVVPPHVAASLIKVLSYYGAHPKGTPEYEAATKGKKHGTGEVHEGEGRGPAEEVHDGVQSDGGGSSASGEADDGPGAAGAAGDGAGDDPSGDGHADAGVPKFEDSADLPEPSEPASVGDNDIAAAIKTLDPDNNDHWVRTGAAAGKPKLSAVEAAYGRAGLTRDDLEAALPGWNRDKAIEALLG